MDTDPLFCVVCSALFVARSIADGGLMRAVCSARACLFCSAFAVCCLRHAVSWSRSSLPCPR
eukprot:11164677-Lingulodinium_polyedra.AAC.1